MPPKKPDPKMAVFSLRLPQKLKDDLEHHAKTARRSLNSEAVLAIEKHVAELNDLDTKIIRSAKR